MGGARRSPWPPASARPCPRRSQPSATTLLRGTAGLVCAMTGGAGLAGSLATRGATLTALGLVAAAALLAAALGRDPAARTVAWIVFSAAGFALPPTALAAAGREPAPGRVRRARALRGAGRPSPGRSPAPPARRADAAVVELVRCTRRRVQPAAGARVGPAHRRRADHLRAAAGCGRAAPRPVDAAPVLAGPGRARGRARRLLAAALRRRDRADRGVHAAVRGGGPARSVRWSCAAAATCPPGSRTGRRWPAASCPASH